MTTTVRPTRQALRMHMSHLATTHRAPLVSRNRTDASTAPRVPGAARPRATAFTPMAPEGVDQEKPRHQVHTQLQSQIQTYTRPQTPISTQTDTQES